MRVLSVSSLVLMLGTVSAAEAQSRVGAYFASGLGGQGTAEQGGFSGDFDLDPTVGVGLRFEVPVGELLHLSPFAEFDAYKADGASGRDLGVDAGLMLRIGPTLDLGAMRLEVYGGIPLGFSAYFPDSSDETMLGFNVGAMAGAQLHVNERVAVMLEMGWQMHRVYEDDANLTANQAKLQLGAMLLL